MIGSKRIIRTLADVGTVLDVGVGDFEIIVSHTPAPDLIMCYGILNKATGIVEGIVNNFALAKQVVAEFHKEATEGVRPRRAPSLQELLGGAPLPDDDFSPPRAN